MFVVDVNFFIDKMDINAIQQYCGDCGNGKKKPDAKINPQPSQDDLLDFDF